MAVALAIVPVMVTWMRPVAPGVIVPARPIILPVASLVPVGSAGDDWATAAAPAAAANWISRPVSSFCDSRFDVLTKTVVFPLAGVDGAAPLVGELAHVISNTAPAASVNTFPAANVKWSGTMAPMFAGMLTFTVGAKS